MENFETTILLNNLILSLEGLDQRYIKQTKAIAKMNALIDKGISSGNRFAKLSVEHIQTNLDMVGVDSELSTEGLVEIVQAIFTFIAKLFKSIVNFITRNTGTLFKKAGKIKPANSPGDSTDNKAEDLSNGQDTTFKTDTKTAKKYKRGENVTVNGDEVYVDPMIPTVVLVEYNTNGTTSDSYLEEVSEELTSLSADGVEWLGLTDKYTDIVSKSLESTSVILSTMFDNTQPAPLPLSSIWGDDALVLFPLINPKHINADMIKTGTSKGNAELTLSFSKMPYLDRKDGVDIGLNLNVQEVPLLYTAASTTTDIDRLKSISAVGRDASKTYKEIEQGISDAANALNKIVDTADNYRETLKLYKRYSGLIDANRSTINSQSMLIDKMLRHPDMVNDGVDVNEVPDGFYDSYVTGAASTATLATMVSAADGIHSYYSNNRTVLTKSLQLLGSFTVKAASTLYGKTGVLNKKIDYSVMVNDLINNSRADDQSSNESIDHEMDWETELRASCADMSFEELEASIETDSQHATVLGIDHTFLSGLNDVGQTPSFESMAIVKDNMIRFNEPQLARLAGMNISLEFIGTIVAGILLGIFLVIAAIVIKVGMLLRKVRKNVSDTFNPNDYKYTYTKGGEYSQQGDAAEPGDAYTTYNDAHVDTPKAESVMYVLKDRVTPTSKKVKKLLGGSSTSGVVNVGQIRASKATPAKYPNIYEMVQTGELSGSSKLGTVNIKNNIDADILTSVGDRNDLVEYLVSLNVTLGKSIPSFIDVYDGMSEWVSQQEAAISSLLDRELEKFGDIMSGSTPQHPFHKMVGLTSTATNSGGGKITLSEKLWPKEVKSEKQIIFPEVMSSSVTRELSSLSSTSEALTKYIDTAMAIHTRMEDMLSKDRLTKVNDMVSDFRTKGDLLQLVIDNATAKDGVYQTTADHMDSIIDDNKLLRSTYDRLVDEGQWLDAFTVDEVAEIVAGVKEAADAVNRWAKQVKSTVLIEGVLWSRVGRIAMYLDKHLTNRNDGLFISWAFYTGARGLMKTAGNDVIDVVD